MNFVSSPDDRIANSLDNIDRNLSRIADSFEEYVKLCASNKVS